MIQERFLGINIEYPQTDKKALRTIVYAARAYHAHNKFQIEGGLPKEGSAIIVANHTSSTDILKIAYTCFTTSERVIRGVARKSLLDPSFKESKEVLERTGKENRFDPLKLPGLAHVIAFTLNGIGAVPVARGEPDRLFLTTCDEVLKSSQLLGMFVQETRAKSGDLSNIMPGIGILARRHPDIPIIPVGIWTPEYGSKVVVGKKATYTQLSHIYGSRLGPRKTTAIVVDTIAHLLPSDIRIKWEVVDRPQLLKR